MKTMSREDAVAAGLYEVIGKEIDDKYMAELKKQIIHPDVIKEMADDIKIVYTPLCGTGNKPVRRILSELGFKHVYVVPEQENPDPNFTTLDYPNPEDPKAFTYALRLAKEKDADIVLATDPDADRLGVYAKDTKTGEYVAFTGNMSGMLIAEYILREKTATGTMPENPALVTTIVTTNMTKPITQAYGVKLIEVLTGFKFIGEQIKLFEQTGSNNYVFGLEESYGCLAHGGTRPYRLGAAPARNRRGTRPHRNDSPQTGPAARHPLNDRTHGRQLRIRRHRTVRIEVFRAAGGRASTTGFARASCGTSRAERGRRSARSGRQPAPPFLRL